jgi:hypothetical protein
MGSAGRTATAVGAFLPHFPVRVPWGRAVAVGFLTIDDDVLEGKLGLTGPPASFSVLGVFNDTGQVVILR